MLNADLGRHLLLALLLVLLLGGGGSARAENYLRLDPPGDFVEVGQPFDVALVMDFADSTTGGGLTVEFDAAILSLDQVTFNGVLAGDPDFSCPGSAAVSCPATPGFLSFGSVWGLSGVGTVATLRFTPIATGATGIHLQPADAFGTSGGSELTVLLEGTAVTGESSIPTSSPIGLGLLALLLTVLAGRALARKDSTRFVPPVAGLVLALLVSPPAHAQGADSDLDGVLDSVDNCTNLANPDQRDTDNDGYGNLCDADLDNDDDIDTSDLDLLKARFFGSDPDADFDATGTVDFLDLGHMAHQFGGGPGPKCTGCPIVSGTFTSTPLISIPDGTGTAAPDTIVITDEITIVELNVEITITHSWVGDLTVTLTHADTGTSAILIDRPGEPDSGFGCSGDDIDATLSDDASDPVEDECAGSTPTIEGTFAPNNPLDVFDGEGTAGSWVLTVQDSSSGDSGTLERWSLGVNDPPVASEITMTAYRPQSESYGNPLIRRAVAEADEENPGAGVRINGDDDDANGVPDRDDSSVAAENDLVEVELGVNQLEPAGVEYVLRRSGAPINVWDSASKGTAILDEADETILTFSALSRSVWVENPNGGSADLEFEARNIGDGSVVASDTISFFAFSSLVIGLHGEFQFPTDGPIYGPNEGISVLAVEFHQEAYDSHMYVENEVASDGSGSVYDEIVSAVQNRGVTNLALYGFSHGGGSVFDLSERLEANKSSIGTFDLTYTAYIDSVENDSDTDLDAEVRLPVATQYHVNYYQASPFWLIWGDSVPGSDVDELVSGLFVSHITITNQSVVQEGIHDSLVLRVPR